MEKILPSSTGHGNSRGVSSFSDPRQCHPDPTIVQEIYRRSAIVRSRVSSDGPPEEAAPCPPPMCRLAILATRLLPHSGAPQQRQARLLLLGLLKLRQGLWPRARGRPGGAGLQRMRAWTAVDSDRLDGGVSGDTAAGGPRAPRLDARRPARAMPSWRSARHDAAARPRPRRRPRAPRRHSRPSGRRRHSRLLAA